TSVWPDSTTPASTSGPIDANRLALVPSSLAVRRNRAPSGRSMSSAKSISARLDAREVVSNATSRSSRGRLSDERRCTLTMRQRLAPPAARPNRDRRIESPPSRGKGSLSLLHRACRRQDTEQLDLEHQHAVGRDRPLVLVAVGELGGDV